MNPIREALENAAAQMEGTGDAAPVEGGRGAGDAGTLGVDEGAAAAEGAAEPVADAGATGGDPEAEGASAAARARDEKGRFATAKDEGKAPPPVAKAPSVTSKPQPGPKSSTPAPRPAAAGGAPAPSVPVTTPTEAPKAPTSWKPAAREKFSALPTEVQAEVSRIDKEVRGVMQENAALRAGGDSGLKQAVAPFEGHIRAEGGDVARTVQSLLQTQHQLRFGSARQKAAILAQVVQQYDVPIQELDSALAGQAAPGGQPSAPQEFRDPRFDTLMASLQQAHTQREQQRVTRAQEEIQALADKSEFFEDVRQDMSDLMQGAARRGLKMTLEEAYSRACRMNSDVWAILQQREADKAAKAQAASTQRARDASSSLRSQPAGTTNGASKPGGIRAALEAAAEAASKR